MCVASTIGDTWRQDFPQRWPHVRPFDTDPMAFATKQEVQELRRELFELRELLAAAKKFDEATGQKDCEMGEKVALIKQLASLLDVDLKGVLD